MNFPSLEAMFDPDTGADYAAQFLQSLYGERGNWSAAAGAYHSQTPSRASVYRARFDRILAGLGGEPLLTVAAAPAEAEPVAPAEAATPRKSRTRLSRGPEDHHHRAGDRQGRGSDRGGWLAQARHRRRGVPHRLGRGGPRLLSSGMTHHLLVNTVLSVGEYWLAKSGALFGATR